MTSTHLTAAHPITRRARRTGSTVTVGSADALGLDSDCGQTKWYTVCDVHGSCVGHRSRETALAFSAAPDDWCEFCASPETWCAACANDQAWCDHDEMLDSETSNNTHTGEQS